MTAAEAMRKRSKWNVKESKMTDSVDWNSNKQLGNGDGSSTRIECIDDHCDSPMVVERAYMSEQITDDTKHTHTHTEEHSQLEHFRVAFQNPNSGYFHFLFMHAHIAHTHTTHTHTRRWYDGMVSERIHIVLDCLLAVRHARYQHTHTHTRPIRAHSNTNVVRSMPTISRCVCMCVEPVSLCVLVVSRRNASISPRFSSSAIHLCVRNRQL